MSSHKRNNNRGPDIHQRHARMASPEGYRGLVPRFSPTASFPDPGLSSSSTVPDPTFDPSAESTSSDPAASTPLFPTRSKTPVLSLTLPTTITTPTDSITTNTSTSSTSILTTTPTSTSTTSTSSTSTSSQPTIIPVVLPSSSVAPITDTNFLPPTSSIVSSATPSSSPSTTGGTSTSIVVGAIAAGLVGVAGLIFVTMFFVRRWRKRGEEETEEFNADAFRRQSAILVDDEPSPYSGGNEGHAGFNPRPPTMIERHMANRNQFDAVPPMPSLQQYHNLVGAGAGAVGAGGYGNEYDYPSQHPSFSPGQVMPVSPPPTLTGAQFFAPHGQAHDSAYDDQGQLVRQPSNGAAIYNENGQPRHPSNASQWGLGRQNSTGGNGHYVDLARSSVTPFQAAQYAEISRKLNASPSALHVVNENDEEPISQASDRTIYANQAREGHSHLSIPVEGGNVNPESPFVDPQVSAEAHHNSLLGSNLNHGSQEVNVPPSPIYSLHSQVPSNERIGSGPPTLPEIRVPDRTFSPTSYDFPQTPSGRPTPSPFHTNFSVPNPPARENFPNTFMSKAGESGPLSPTQVTVPGLSKREVTPTPESPRPASTYTVYDEADAYGGI